ncbi:MAG: DUF308 domain-containing protein [Ruminococcus sp.]|nr:DUF308 domain-containing protein [Ruminococcus sp.]
MFQRLSKLFRNYWILSVFCIVLGAALIVDPHFFTKSISWVIGGLFAAYGIVYLVKYFINSAQDSFGADLVKGVILIAIGVFIIVRWEFIPNVIAIFTGFYMLISSVISLQSNLRVKKAGMDGWQTATLFSVLTLAAGCVLIFNPLMGVSFAMTVLGAALLISGIANLISCFSVSRKLGHLKKSAKSGELAVYRGGNSDDDDYIDI